MDVVGSITLLQCVKKFFVWVEFYAGAKCGVSLFVQPAWGCCGRDDKLRRLVINFLVPNYRDLRSYQCGNLNYPNHL